MSHVPDPTPRRPVPRQPDLRVVRADPDSPAARVAVQRQFVERAKDQGLAALSRLDEDFDRCPKLPWSVVHRHIDHGLLPDQFWVLAAASGHGKSTAAMNLVRAWVEEGRRVHVIPLEQPSDVMRIYFAALMLGLDTRYALSNHWKRLPPNTQDALKRNICWQMTEAADRLSFSDRAVLTLDGLREEYAAAAAFGADVVMVDHIHHVRLPPRSGYEGFTELAQLGAALPKEYRIPFFATAQLNRGAGPIDPLRAFLCPLVDHIQNGKVLEQCAHVVLACFRPLVDGMTKAQRQSVRLRLASVKDYLKRNTIGLGVLKSRIAGEIGAVEELAFHRGRITDPESADDDEERYGL